MAIPIDALNTEKKYLHEEISKLQANQKVLDGKETQITKNGETSIEKTNIDMDKIHLEVVDAVRSLLYNQEALSTSYIMGQGR
jgi:NurA-like 5'-3' nuclease